MLSKLFIKILVFTVLNYNISNDVYSSNTIDNVNNNNTFSKNNKVEKLMQNSRKKSNIKDIQDKENNEKSNTNKSIENKNNILEQDNNNNTESDNENGSLEDDGNDGIEGVETEDGTGDDTDEEDSDDENDDDSDEDDEEEDSVYDPFEKFNRKVSEFNDTMNTLLDKAMQKNKDKSKPSVISKGISNFSHNFFESPRIINYALQGNVKNASNSIARLMINTLFGFFGVADVAEKLGFEKKDTNFGKTLKKWGMKPGPYVVLPILGPTSLRGTVGNLFEFITPSTAKMPLENMKPLAKNITYYSIYCCNLLAKRAAYGDMIEQVSSMSKDKYKTFRSITMSSESN